VVHLKFDWILYNIAKMLAAFHMVFATIMVVANMRNLFILAIFVVLHTHVKVINVFVVFVVDNVIGMLLRQL
jgi:hypothetical protein